MRAFIVFAHPEPRSYGSTLLREAVNTLQEKGHEVLVSDLNSGHSDKRPRA